MKSGLTMRLAKSADILKALKAIGKKDVLVGIPESEHVRDGEDIGNAAIGFINENRSPPRHIPATQPLVLGV